MFNFRLWGKGLLAAAIGGAATAATTLVADPAGMSNPKALGASVGVGALVGGLGYLKTHPPVDALPDELEGMAALGIGAAVGVVEKKLPKATSKTR